MLTVIMSHILALLGLHTGSPFIGIGVVGVALKLMHNTSTLRVPGCSAMGVAAVSMFAMVMVIVAPTLRTAIRV